MHVVIFSYERAGMLKKLLHELRISEYKITVIDDGSNWSKDNWWEL